MSQQSTTAVDVAVIGGGVIGLAIAWRAAQRGLDAVVLERDRAGSGTSHHAAGMIAPIAEATPAEEPLMELGRRGAEEYEAFARELAAAAGTDSVGYLRCGTLMVARDADEAAALERSYELRRGWGLPVSRLRASEARRLEPGLAPALRLALDVPDDHAVDPRVLSAALAAAASRAGAVVHEQTPVTGVELGGEAVSGVRLADGRRVAARNVVVAAGTWSGQIEGIPPAAQAPVRPVKGQIMRLHDPAGPGLLTRVIRIGATYIVPRGDGRYVLGATQEERGFDLTVTAGAAFELLRDAGELVPGVSEWVLDEFSAGLRPGTPDNLPIIGPGSVEGLYWATGHRRGGILLTSVTAELIADLLTGRTPDPRVAAFSPRRFETAPAVSRP